MTLAVGHERGLPLSLGRSTPYVSFYIQTMRDYDLKKPPGVKSPVKKVVEVMMERLNRAAGGNYVIACSVI